MKRVEGVYAVGSLAEIAGCEAIGPNFAKAVAFLRRQDLKSLPNGRYELDGDNAYAMVQETTLKTWGAGRPEVHRVYFDIQVPLTGEETIGLGTFDPAARGEFDEEKDIGFYDEIALEPVVVHPGEFAVLYPETCAHAPCCADEGGDVIRKIVIKVRK